MVQRLENEFSSTDERWAICTGTTDCSGLTNPQIYYSSPLRREDRVNNSPSTADSWRFFLNISLPLQTPSYKIMIVLRKLLQGWADPHQLECRHLFWVIEILNLSLVIKGLARIVKKSSNSHLWTPFVAINALSLKACQRSNINYSPFCTICGIRVTTPKLCPRKVEFTVKPGCAGHSQMS